MVNTTVVKYENRESRNKPRNPFNKFKTKNPYETDYDTDYDIKRKQEKKAIHDEIKGRFHNV
jgi:hypothetical protein